jgi:hypothetical protein
MSSGRARRLLYPKWWVLHLFVIACCVTMVFLGRWQWHVAHRHNGDIRYYAYAFQWWAFTGFALVMWLRVVLDYLRTGAGAEPRPEQDGEPTAGPGYLAYVPPASPAPDDDPERLRFNAYLRELDQSKGSQ